MRYLKDIRGLPWKCPCDQSFNVNYAMNCKTGGFLTIRHSKISCTDVETEPSIHPINGQIVAGLTGDETKPDVHARGVRRPSQKTFFLHSR